MEIKFSVGFVAGKLRARARRTPTGIQSYTPAGTVANMNIIALEYERACWEQLGELAYAPADTPVRVEIITHQAVPNSRKKSIEWEHATFKPDVDNVGKLVLDALNGVAYEDDKQIVELSVIKAKRVRGITPYTEVLVKWSEEDEPNNT